MLYYPTGLIATEKDILEVPKSHTRGSHNDFFKLELGLQPGYFGFLISLSQQEV